MTKIISLLSVILQLYTTGHCLAQNRTARADSARKELRLRVGFGTLGKAHRNNVLGGVVAEISQDISKSSSIRLGCSFNLDRLGIPPLTADSFFNNRSRFTYSYFQVSFGLNQVYFSNKRFSLGFKPAIAYSNITNNELVFGSSWGGKEADTVKFNFFNADRSLGRKKGMSFQVSLPSEVKITSKVSFYIEPTFCIFTNQLRSSISFLNNEGLFVHSTRSSKWYYLTTFGFSFKLGSF